MSQSLSNILLHIIYSTKQREALIDTAIASELYAYIVATSAAHGSYVRKIGGIEDHVHILTSLPRTLSVSELMEQQKKNSSKWIKSKGSKYQAFSWQKGFGVFSVSESQSEAVSKYIEDQREHHKKHSYQDEYRLFLKLNNIPFDERYVWD